MGQGASHSNAGEGSSSNDHGTATSTSSNQHSAPANTTPTRLRSTLAHSRSIKRDRDRDRDNKDASNSSKPPRRKSLDMPDLSLSMTGTGTITATPSALTTPAIPASTLDQKNGRNTAASSSQGYPYPGTPVSGHGPDDDSSNSPSTGIPMANSPLGPISPTSPVAQAAAAASRWARVKNREGLMKKAQPVTGSAAALNAVAYQNSLLQQQQQQQQVASNASSAASTGTHTPTYNTNKQGQMLHPVVTGGSGAAVHSAPQSLAGVLLDSLGSPLSPPSSAVANHPSIFASSLTSTSTALPTPSSSLPQMAILPPAPTPLKQPTETVLAPKLPKDVVSLVVSPAATVPILPQELLGPRLALAVANAAANVSSSSSSSSHVSETAAPAAGGASSNPPSGRVSRSSSMATLPGVTTSSYPATPPPELYNTAVASPIILAGSSGGGGNGSVPPGSTPPLGNPPNTLPAAAPIETILLQNNHDMNLNAKTKEAVENATLNCFVKDGEEGVTTLLTWKAEEEEAASAQNINRLASPGNKNSTLPSVLKQKGKYTNEDHDDLASHAATPKQVFVTGTFANQWGTKVELRRKEGEDGTPTTNDFTALVKMPPGPHTLKFIVDKQWKTSKYLPSATDADGNLINYLQVNKPEEIAAIGEVITQQQQQLRQQQQQQGATSSNATAGPSSGSAAGTGTHSPVAAAVMAAAMAGIAVTTPDGTVAAPSYSYQHYFQQGENGGFGPPSPVAGPSGSSAAKAAQSTMESPAKSSTATGQDKTTSSSSPARQRDGSTSAYRGDAIQREASQRSPQAPSRYQPPQRTQRDTSAYASIEQTLQWEDDSDWTSEIPAVLIAYGDASEAALDFQEAQERALAEKQNPSGSHSLPPPNLPGSLSASNSAPHTPISAHDHNNNLGGASSIPSSFPQHSSMLLINRKPLSQLISIQPPTLPAQLEKGVLNATVLVAKGSGDDNSILPRPDHSVLNHLAASPIKGGLLSVGVTTRYRQKYVTTVYYKKPV